VVVKERSLSDFSELLGPRPGLRVRFGTCLKVGRHPANDLRLTEQEVSSFHAVIEWVNDGWSVRDLGSRNGTTLNGRRLVQRAGLQHGDVLRFARGPAWRVERLAATPDLPPEAEHGRTSGLQRALPDDLHLELRAEGPGDGSIVVTWGGQGHEQRAANSFLLLDFLAQQPGQWVTDAEVRSVLWGKRGKRMGRNALHQLIYNTRRVFEGWGLEGCLIEKEQGATRLCLDADQVSFSGVRDGLVEE
jgi:hypothetical protein